ncbi:MAG: hemin ABC transporter substrate-binding protein [Rhizobiaceae bacterium]|nr:MAG: hemin ABC transporter substrate-binding protein [Rhizobiaceae bacterium]CAG1011964.1 Hemin-binding periplasmic protein HmuT [Rhizobiaceae bacterium]
MAFLTRARATMAATLLLAAHVAAASETVGTLPDSSKLVAIGGSITEIVYALGEERRLIARDTTSVYPPAALALPDVGYMRQLSPEGVLSVGPSAVIALEGSGPREAIDVLKKASVPFLEVPETFDRDGIVVKIRAVGEALGVNDKAKTLAASVATDLDAAEKTTASIGERKRVMFLLSAQGGKLLASGSGTAADGVIRLAGAVNAVEGYEGYKPITDEAVITAAPDVILMMDRSGDPDPSADIFANPAIASTPAGQAKRLVRMDAAYLLGFGPRTAAAVRDLVAQLYGDRVAK